MISTVMSAGKKKAHKKGLSRPEEEQGRRE
jgi:hypothetical protein